MLKTVPPGDVEEWLIRCTVYAKSAGSSPVILVFIFLESGSGFMKKERRKRSPVWNSSDEVFKKIVSESFSIREIILKLGLEYSESYYKTINRRINEGNIDISHMKRISSQIHFTKSKTPLSEILVENSSYNRNHLKNRLIKEKLLINNCYECGLGGVWNGKPLSLQLDHINGKNNDNRITNLRLLCPNCHSQTETFGARNHKKISLKCKNCSSTVSKKSSSGLCRKCYNQTLFKVARPTLNELIQSVSELGYVKTGIRFGVSDNTIRKWIRNYNQDTSTKEMK